MNKIKNLLAGLSGAVALNVLHESLKHKSDNMPRVDLLGEEVLQKTLQYFGRSIDKQQHLYPASLAGDIIGNTLYFSLIGAGDQKNIWPKVLIIGLSAGIGAITIPKPLGLDSKPVAKNSEVKVLTLGYYLLGAVVTGLALTLLKKS